MKSKAKGKAESDSYRDELARQAVEHEVARRNIRAAANVMVGHAVELALTSPEARQVMDEMFDPRPSLARTRQARRAWAGVVREIVATLQRYEPPADPSPAPEAAG